MSIPKDTNRAPSVRALEAYLLTYHIFDNNKAAAHRLAENLHAAFFEEPSSPERTIEATEDVVVYAQNSHGEYVPAIPEPFFGFLGRCTCECGKVCGGRENYRGHYALVHILGLRP